MSWRTLVRGIGASMGAITLVVAVVLRDVDAFLITALIGASIALLRFRKGGLGVVGLTFAFLLTGFWCVAGAIVNLSRDSTFVADALTSVLGVLALAGLAAVVASALKASGSAARVVAVGTAVLVVAALVVSLLSSGSTKADARSGDITLVAQHAKFVPTRIEAHAGRIGVALSNRDFFWHTFTISGLHVNLNVATRGQGRISFDAPPGTYTFVCLIHEQIGMKGTLVVH
jgi:plastocyanin